MATGRQALHRSQRSNRRAPGHEGQPDHREVLHAEHHLDGIIGYRAARTAARTQLDLVAPTDATVLLQGVPCTGKALRARARHTLRARRTPPVVTRNGTALPTGLLESERFGHEKGACTGTVTQRMGRFELAHRGTRVLDEVGEIPLEVPPTLRRALWCRPSPLACGVRCLQGDQERGP